ncbi:hypothetical protein H4582DRAFT_1827305 [Lactarius indigo]|nr:hypothetical protein H4582DRAFT_1827305 [Lactarius indigo]
MSACPVTIHALLHISDSIKTCGPVWCYWAFPMERYCNRLKPSIRSRQSPYASIDRYILEDAQLTQIKAMYGLADELALQPQRSNLPQGAYRSPYCEPYTPIILQSRFDFPIEDLTCVLLCPRVVVQRGTEIIRKYLQQANIEEWGKVWRVDSEAGDTIHSLGLMKPTADRRDATFVRYVMLVDRFARQRRRKPVFEPQTFYGRLEHLYLIHFTCSDAQVDPQKPIILAAIQNCKTKDPGPTDLESLDIHLYNTTGSLDLVDVTSVQALVGRVEYTVDSGGWAIIDRSGGLACAEWEPTAEDDEFEVFRVGHNDA